MTELGLQPFLVLSAFLFVCGVVCIATKRNAIGILMGVELVLNAANVNLVAFWRYGTPAPAEGPLAGVMMAIFVITIAAAEVAVGIGLILLCYRRWHAADVDRFNSLSG